MTTTKPRWGRVTSRMLTACAGAAALSVLLVSGCTNGDSPGDSSNKTPSAAAPVSTAPAKWQAQHEDRDDHEAHDSDRIPPGPKVPKDELTPATGTINKKEKEYLTDRVPKGIDPAAILEAGQEACDRITSLVGRDRKAAVQAIKSGEITGARDAITQLCPEHKPLLEAAQ